MKQIRETDKKERNLLVIERHEKDDPSLPTYKTYYAQIKTDDKKNPRLKKIASSYENISIATIREMVADEIQQYNKNGFSSYTLEKYFYEFYKPTLLNKGRKTIKDIEDNFLRDIKPEFGHLIITSIKSDDLYKWFLNLSQRSKGTANHCLTTIKAMYNQAIIINQAKYNPADKISKNYIPSRKRYFTDSERDIFLKELKAIGQDSPYGSAFIYLAYLSGARKGELAKATWDDLIGNTIVLKEHKTDDKTDEPRVIYLNDEAMDLINRLPKDTKTILKIKDPVRQWRKIMKRTGIKNFRFHDLRHNFGTQGMNMGIEMLRVGTLMGHTSIKAMQIYQTVKPEIMQKDIKEIGNYLTN